MGRKERLKAEMRKKKSGGDSFRKGVEKVEADLGSKLDRVHGIKAVPNTAPYRFSDVFGEFLKHSFPEEALQEEARATFAGRIGVMAWNQSVLDATGKSKTETDELFEKMLKSFGVVMEEVKTMIGQLKQIKADFFSEYLFVIQDIQINFKKGQMFLAVAGVIVG
jgi:hypothetical protein